MPHALHLDVGDRIRTVHRAWCPFLKSLNRWLKRCGVDGLSHWFRSFEWTPATDGLGHPHIHVWIFGPYLPHGMLREWWRRALLVAGLPEEDLATVIVDVREVRDGGAEREVIKYMTKDLVAGGAKVAAHLYAIVYECMDGLRTTQSSSRFMQLAQKSAKMCECGATGCFSVRVIRSEAARSALGQSDPAISGE